MLIFSTSPDKTTLKGCNDWIFFQNLTVLFPWVFPKAISKGGKARRCQRHINALHCLPCPGPSASPTRTSCDQDCFRICSSHSVCNYCPWLATACLHGSNIFLFSCKYQLSKRYRRYARHIISKRYGSLTPSLP